MVRAAMTAVQGGRAGRQRQTAGWLRERVVVVEAEGQALRAERDQLAGQVERLTGETRRLQARVGELEAKVEELRRAGKRQAAPFPRDRPSPRPGRPGPQAWAAYGQQGRRLVPERVDRVVAVGLPEVCRHCGGALGVERIACQWQEDSRMIWRRCRRARPQSGPGCRRPASRRRWCSGRSGSPANS